MGKPVAPAYDQDSFRVRDNVPDPTGVDAAFDAGDTAKNGNFSYAVDTQFRIRFLIQQTVATANLAADLATEFLLQYNLGGAGWNRVTATSPIQYSLAAGYADHANTVTQLLGAGTRVTGDGLETNVPTDTISFTAAALTETELEVSLKIDSAQVVNNDTIQLRWLYSLTDASPPATVCEAYTNTPTVTVIESAPVNVDVPLATLTLTGYVPTVVASDNQVVTVPLATLVLTGYAPTIAVSDNRTIAVPLATLVLTGYAPTVTVTANVNIAVPLGTLTLTGYAPTVAVTEHVNVEVPAGTLTLTGYAPTVVVGGGVEVAVPLATLTLTGHAPTVTVSNNITVAVPAATLTLTGYAPTVAATANVKVSVPVASLALTGYAPTITVTTIGVVVETSGGKPAKKPWLSEEWWYNKREEGAYEKLQEELRAAIARDAQSEGLLQVQVKRNVLALVGQLYTEATRQATIKKQRLFNLEKAKIAKEKKAARAEEINRARLKNLKKARAAKKRKRKKEKGSA